MRLCIVATALRCFRAHGAAAGQADGADRGAMRFVDMAQIGVLFLHE
ncbi:hypothetical protein [Azospirillum argentinense]